LIRGVQVLHKADIAHRDLKFQNLRLNQEGQVVIIDLDGAGYGSRFTDIVTTIVTRAPEVLKREIRAENEPYMYDPKPLDMWSLGILALELAHGSSLPISMETEITAPVMLELLDSHLHVMLCENHVRETLGPRLFEAVRHCLDHDPRLRPTIKDLETYNCVETCDVGPLY
jgi:serine/threonine protein kinase